MARGASQPRVAQEHPPLGPAAMETVDKETRDSSVQGNGSNKKKAKKNKVTVTTTGTSINIVHVMLCVYLNVYNLIQILLQVNPGHLPPFWHLKLVRTYIDQYGDSIHVYAYQQSLTAHVFTVCMFGFHV